MMAKKMQETISRRVALIGLVGTVLTVCGTLTGALIGGATTVYKVMRASEQLAIPDTKGENTLNVDTGQIDISVSDAEALKPDEYLKFPELGFVMEQAKDGWTDRGGMSYDDLFQGEAVNFSPLIFYSADIGRDWDTQPVRQFRYDQPVTVTFVDGSTENGVPEGPDLLIHDTVAFYSQITVLALDKKIAVENFNLYGLALKWGALHQGGVNEIIASENSPYVFEQVSWELKNVEIDGKVTDLTLERWALFTEGEKRYYIVEVQYVPAEDQPTDVWDTLQEYMKGFHVIDVEVE